MRVVLTSLYTWPEVRRGGERYVHELGAALTRAGHEVSILSTGAQPSRDEVLGVPVERVARRPVAPGRLRAQAVEVGFGLQCLRRLAGRPVDVWHATGLDEAAAACLLAAARRGLRTVVTDHGLPRRDSRAKRADAPLQAWVARRIGAYVCVSEAAGDCLRADYHREPVVVPPGVDVASYRPAATRTPHPVLLYSGTFDESRKNLPLLLAAVALLRARIPDLQVWLLGSGDASAHLAAAPAAARDAVTVCRHVVDAELRERYATAWATVLPSVNEAFGMAVTESLASGTPVVVLSGSGGPERIVRDPGVGVRAAADPRSLAAACEAAFALAQDPATAARCRAVAEDYDWSGRVVPALEQVYANAG